MGLLKFIRFVALGGMAVLSVLDALAQQSPAFEVASIKPSRNGSADPNINSLPGGRFIATNITVKELVRLAFGVKDYQIARGPGWIDANGFDIVATGPTGKKTAFEDEQSRVRALLTDRFQLKVHREMKQMPVYALIVAKNGPKLKEHNDGSGSGTRKGCGRLAGTRLTMDTIATVLSRQFERDVLNRTGLPGKYDFQLDWTPESGPCSAAADGSTGADRSGLPSIFTALQEQLGLRLEPGKGPVEILIIDHVERPSEN